MQQLYQARDRIEAQILRDLLDRHLIETVILGDYLSGAIGELPADIYPTLWLIDNADLDRGLELLRHFFTEKDAREDGEAWICASCGELVSDDFEICWNCNQAKPTSE
ncbi:putative signal transducing protein [Thiocystis violacea]|uniref:putative signal transducing protein n=1 Tax=Thiocystis violacea TaxID=13725 RepID=UPI001903927E|nr:DUF2007 domain-containing protein [Thiocystis violacea]MBK1724352.1 hypothetical protein [Thiocystis violacea]